MSLLNSSQIAILQAIKEGKSSTDLVAQATGLSLDTVRYYQDSLEQEQYIQCAKTFATGGVGRDYTCVMKPKGNVALEDSNLLLQPNLPLVNQTYISDSYIGFVNSANGTVKNFSQNIGQNLSEVKQLIDSIRQAAEIFPEVQRDEVTFALDDLETDLGNSEKHQPKRIQNRIARLWKVACILGVTATSVVAFSKDVLELAEKLGTPIEIQHIDENNQQLPPSP